MLAKFIENFFSELRDGKHPPAPRPTAVVHQGADGKWYLNVGYRLAENFDTKLVLSIEEASEDKSMIVALARDIVPEAEIVERPYAPGNEGGNEGNDSS